MAAARVDPHAAEVCRVITQVKDGMFDLGTESFVNINRRRVVLTAATLENPAQVEFFGSDNSVNRYSVVHTKSKGTIKVGNLTASNLQVLFLEGEPAATPLELVTGEKLWPPFIPELIYESIARVISGVPFKVIGYGDYYTKLQRDLGDVDTHGFVKFSGSVRINLGKSLFDSLTFSRFVRQLKADQRYFPRKFRKLFS
jgi:hypothetical protein